MGGGFTGGTPLQGGNQNFFTGGTPLQQGGQQQNYWTGGMPLQQGGGGGQQLGGLGNNPALASRRWAGLHSGVDPAAEAYHRMMGLYRNG